MNEVKDSLKWLFLYGILLVMNSLFCTGIIPLAFPTVGASSIFLLIVSIALILHYYLRLTGQELLRGSVMGISYMIFLLVLLRAIKYTVLGNVIALGRYTWYAYYVPILLMPMLLFFVSLFVYAQDEKRIRRRWGWVAGVTLLMILFVLTNDWHQCVFRFQPDFVNWDGSYSHRWGFVVITAWQYVMYAAAVFMLVLRCSIANIIYRAWLILLPFAIGIALVIILEVGAMPQLNGNNLIEYPEILCFMNAAVLECSMQLGLISTNKSYRRLMQITSLPVQIMDFNGNALYYSGSARSLTKEQITLPDDTRIGKHTILRKLNVSGGYGFWEEDVTELDRLSDELAETKERLAEEAELIRLENELKEKRSIIEQRNRVYDRIAKRTQRQSLTISHLAHQAKQTSDVALKNRYRKQITLLGAYIKRYANLMLLSADNGVVASGELGLSFTEVLRYLNQYGIPGELINSSTGMVSSEKGLAVFEAFEELVEWNLQEQSGVYVFLDSDRDSLVVKVTLENIKEQTPEQLFEKLGSKGVSTQFEWEEGVGYYRFTVPLGGESV